MDMPLVLCTLIVCLYTANIARIVRVIEIFNRIVAKYINTLTSFCLKKNIYRFTDQELIIISITKLILEAFYKTIYKAKSQYTSVISFSLSMLQPNRILTFQMNVYV